MQESNIARRRRRGLLAALLALAAAPLGAQLAPTDLVTSAPGNGVIWKSDMDTGVGSPLAAGVLVPHYGWFGPDGNFYVPDRGWGAILRITPAGAVSALTVGGHLDMPVTCIPTAEGDAWIVTDMGANKILHVDFAGNQTVLHDSVSTNGLLDGPDGIALADDGTLYVANLGSHTVVRIDPDGNASIFSDSPLLNQPGGVALDGAGNLFVASYTENTIVRFRVDTGVGEIFAGPEEDKISHPNDLKLARSGGLVTSGRPGKVARVDALGNITVLMHEPQLGELVGVSIPEDATLCDGRFTSYGAGVAGSGGFVPELRAIFSPCPGQTIGLELRGALGGAPAVMFIGTSELAAGAAHFKGAPLLVDPSSAFFMVLPLIVPGFGAGEGGFTLQFQIPDQPSLSGVEIFHQLFVADPAAPTGMASSNGLKERIGS